MSIQSQQSLPDWLLNKQPVVPPYSPPSPLTNIIASSSRPELNETIKCLQQELKQTKQELSNQVKYGQDLEHKIQLISNAFTTTLK
jgi:hypothetical protein